MWDGIHGCDHKVLKEKNILYCRGCHEDNTYNYIPHNMTSLHLYALMYISFHTWEKMWYLSDLFHWVELCFLYKNPSV